jgi:hypothetical protein
VVFHRIIPPWRIGRLGNEAGSPFMCLDLIKFDLGSGTDRRSPIRKRNARIKGVHEFETGTTFIRLTMPM